MERVLNVAPWTAENYRLIPVPSPDITKAEEIDQHRVVRLDALVRMKLTSFRDKDRMHLRDMIDVELMDESWRERLPPELAARL